MHIEIVLIRWYLDADTNSYSLCYFFGSVVGLQVSTTSLPSKPNETDATGGTNSEFSPLILEPLKEPPEEETQPSQKQPQKEQFSFKELLTKKKQPPSKDERPPSKDKLSPPIDYQRQSKDERPPLKDKQAPSIEKKLSSTKEQHTSKEEQLSPEDKQFPNKQEQQPIKNSNNELVITPSIANQLSLIIQAAPKSKTSSRLASITQALPPARAEKVPSSSNNVNPLSTKLNSTVNSFINTSAACIAPVAFMAIPVPSDNPAPQVRQNVFFTDYRWGKRVFRN